MDGSMKWGVGTGRCGTKSLAVQMGGVHEPKPWLGDMPARAASGLDEDGERDELRGLLAERLQLDVPIVVDFKQSWIIDMILSVDPTAEFVALFRSPMLCVPSMMVGGWWTEKDWNGTRKLAPMDGWGKDDSRLYKATWYWRATNAMILNFASEHPERVTFLRTEHDLTERQNVYQRSPGVKLTREQADKILQQTWYVWAKLMEAYAWGRRVDA